MQFEDILQQVNPSINISDVQNEYMSILHFCFQQFQAHLHAPYKLWQYLIKVKKTKDWGNIFTVIELCMCTPCSNAALERIFSQIHIVKQITKSSFRS